MKIDFLKKYIIPNEKESENKEYEHLKHHFFPLSNNEINLVNREIEIPLELKIFYTDIGYGFFFQKDKNYFDRLLDVISFKKINLRQDYYQFDPDLELYDSPNYNDKLIFFELSEGTYLLIERVEDNKKNAIYFFNKKIADSLEEFLVRFYKEGHYFEK